MCGRSGLSVPAGKGRGRVYLFPLSAEISKKDRQIQFEAQIRRIVLAQDFYLTEMAFLGKLEL